MAPSLRRKGLMMETVFSHIIQTRFSHYFEDVATEALAYILNSNQHARMCMMRLLRGVEPSLPELHFRTQQTEKNTRPDMWGYNGTETHVYVENKFWAGLTDNQPVSYLRQLGEYKQPTLLLTIVPGAREQMMTAELSRRLREADITAVEHNGPALGVVWYVKTDAGPWLALTSWQRLLEILEAAVKDDTSARNDLLQLRSLCEAADIDEFKHVSAEEVTNQRIPALVLQLGRIVRACVDKAVNLRILSTEGLTEQRSWEKWGKYAWILERNKVGIWFGIDLVLWKTHGRSPLWVEISTTEFGRANEVKPLMEEWSAKRGGVIELPDGSLGFPVDVDTGVDKDQVRDSIVRQLGEIAEVLSPIGVRSQGSGG